MCHIVGYIAHALVRAACTPFRVGATMAMRAAMGAEDGREEEWKVDGIGERDRGEENC